MALFSKNYHPLDSRHPRNRAGAQAGIYGVQTTKSKVRATPVSRAQAVDKHNHLASTKPQRFQRKLSQVEQMNALVAETQARTNEREHQPHIASPFVTSAPVGAMAASQTPPAPPKQRSKIGKGFQILANMDRNIRIGMLIAVVIYILITPELRAGLTSLAINGEPDGMTRMPSYSSKF
ncbi:hypothetical protein [Pacificibacter marinus]|uniref:hypothetical protein n=1 Tax=Pacificibacter marinus TaxID=658057 RepID=UPI001C07B1ED|nr:hypothetical protein [Pacificibacter marinus]MBU2868438.1 hypothetical protein [Pacificibacter marinus]